MSLRARLMLLMVLLTLLPALPTVWITRQLIGQSLSLGLNPQVDGALEAGTRRAREQLSDQRLNLEHEISRWAEAWVEGSADAEALRQRASAWTGPVLGEGDRVELITTEGEHIVMHAGAPEAEHHQPVSADGTPPGCIEATAELPAGGTVLARRCVSEWQKDAMLLVSTLQIVRGLQVQRQELENRFYLPFILIYALALLIGLLMALRLGGGITRPVGRLLSATKAVSGGDWNFQVPVGGGGEIGSLTTRFNSMVRTLDAQNRSLVDLEKMAGWREMARALAHEVKNPLTPIQLTVEEMRQRYKGDDDEYRQLLDECSRIVVEEVNSLRQVVTRFREFSRPVAPQMGKVDLNALVTDLASLQKDMQVELELDEELGTVEADGDKIRQVLMNLAENARSATREAEPPKLLLSTTVHGDRVILEVQDNGPGIPVADRGAVFEPYRSGTAGGLGLGLALVKGIVLTHQGTITAAGGRWGGACIRIDLPRRQEQNDSDINKLSSKESRTGDRS